jgi:RNA 3'-terminal phosphate cyclase
LSLEAAETLELNAQDREGIVLDLALPVLAAWEKSTRVFGFRTSMGVSGLSPREVARLRTLALATGSRATGIFEGANDFRLGFRAEGGGPIVQPGFGVDADLGGHPIAPVVSDLTIASFGLAQGRGLTHQIQGLTHVRAASAQGHEGRALAVLGREMGLNLEIIGGDLGFEPHGLGRVALHASRHAHGSLRLDWKDRGDLRAIHVELGGVRPRTEQFDLIEAEIRDTLWEARRVEPVLTRRVTPGVDSGAFLQMDVEAERGAATFVEVVGRTTAPLPLVRRMVKKALGYLDSGATFDETTGIAALACAIAARAGFELALAPSDRLRESLLLLRDLGASVEEDEAPGLVLLRTT